MRHMDGDALYSIGEMARRTGLTVKAIRFYSDAGTSTPRTIRAVSDIYSCSRRSTAGPRRTI